MEQVNRTSARQGVWRTLTVQSALAAKCPRSRLSCTQQPGPPTRGSTLRARQRTARLDEPGGMASFLDSLRCADQAPEHCVQVATVHFHALGPSAPSRAALPSKRGGLSKKPNNSPGSAALA